ncbi:AraC family transcriptional regulator [Microbacterium sp. M3]|uniref:AraC family transcriptional regulator n=2 Tax=Microbacterium arthrosphaerae TaxID=792652 RepID=A0ABU4H120_9MICO|nr:MULTISPECIES: AraC family transcriptional regulator [Microbacterium]MDW4573017.1 AraC family transcriptional regulator [Microbacterium arthrosphaerae]MDW7606872.1 AraC family transcriptional regulator [Microbacterium sp. M3]
MDDMSLVRGTSLLGFTDLVDELGGDPDELLARVHLPRAAIGDHDTFVSYRSVVAVLEAAAPATGAGDFGRRLGARQGLEILGPLGVAARTAPTVGEALQAIEQYMTFYSPALAVGVRPGPGSTMATLEWRLVAERPPTHRQAAELGLGVTCRVIRLLAGDDFLPTTVQLRHEPLAERAGYVQYFGCPVEFSAPLYGFTFPAAILARPLKSDSAVHAVVQDYLNTIVVPTASTTVDAVIRLIRRMLPTGALDLDLVASQLAQHRRTLQRQLSAQGTSFARLVDDVRRDEAERHLRDTDMPLGQLAGVIGLSEQSALTRACRRWFGATPTEVRRRGSTGLSRRDPSRD